MNKKIGFCIVLFGLLLSHGVQAQTAKKMSYTKGAGPADFPELVFAKIKGAPTLQMPQLIMGSTGPVLGEGMGWAAPAWFDVDQDGKKDLLVGEFSSGAEKNGIPAGHFVRVYNNKGTAESPRFRDYFTYLMPNFQVTTTGTPLSIHTWCCIGFTPRFADLDNDGHDDLLTGQYNPGRVTWFRGTDSGFLLGKFIPQFADDNGAGSRGDLKLPIEDERSWEYWNYSSVDFGDFDGKGMYDMIVGGGGLRISKNVGTKSEPKFGRREILLDINGQPLTVGPAFKLFKNDAGRPLLGVNIVPTVADWDRDGIPDLLVTDSYFYPGSEAIVFFRAVRTPSGLRFEPGVPLFTARNKQKAFPGSWMRVYVADYNSDGVQDLIVGTSVATMSGKFDHSLSWQWESETDIIKRHAANRSAESEEIIARQMKEADSTQAAMKLNDKEMEKRGLFTRTWLFKHYYGKEAYKNLSHVGYLYVLLGKKEN